MSVAWDPFDPAFKANPYPTYRALVEEQPLYHSPFGPLLVSRYEDCLTLLRHPAASSDATKLPGWEPPPGVSPETLISSFFNLDPPDHTHRRGLVSRAFTPQRVERLRPRMQQIVDEALDRAAERGGMEVVGELAFPLPVLIICELLGVPTEDIEQFKVWSANAVRGIDPLFTLSPQVLERHLAAYDQLRAYFHELIAVRRGDPRDDLLSALLGVEEQDDRLSEPELVINLIMLLIAGHETTVNLVANGMLAFARHPGQFERLRHDPALIRSAVEEVLRFDPPLHLRYRLPLKDIELSAGTVPAFAELFLVVAAANRDPRQFDDPQRFDIARPTTAISALGSGSITASARRWRASRARSPSGRWPGVSRGSSSCATHRRTRRTSRCRAWPPGGRAVVARGKRDRHILGAAAVGQRDGGRRSSGGPVRFVSGFRLGHFVKSFYTNPA